MNTRPSVHAVKFVIPSRWLVLTMVSPPPCSAQSPKATRAPTPTIHRTTAGPVEMAGVADIEVGEDLFRNSPMTVGKIVQRTGLAQSQVSRIVASMKDAGLVAASPDPTDGRRTVVTLAPGVLESHGRSRAARGIRDALAAHLAASRAEPAPPELVDAIIADLEHLADLLET